MTGIEGRRGGRPTAHDGQLAFGALLVCLIWAPIPLASNRSWALALIAMLSSGTLMAVLVSAAFSRAEARVRLPRRCGLPLALLLGYGLLLLVQLVPLPQTLRALFVQDATLGNTITVDPFATRKYLLACVAYASVFALVVLLVDTRQRLAWLMSTIVFSATAQAVLAVYLLSLRAEYEFLFTAFPADGRAVGSFANTDHLAAYLQLGLAVGLGLMLTGVGSAQSSGSGWRSKTVVLLQFLMSTKMLVRLLLVMMVMALVLTRSRGGNAAFFFGLLLAGVWVAIRSRELRKTAVVIVTSMLVVDVLVVGQWIGLDKVVQRMEATTLQRQEEAAASQADVAPSVAARHAVYREESLEERLYAARYALGMLKERPLLGFGGGTFHSAFPRFKGEHPLGQYDHAHNDYVEIAADTGLPGAGLLLALVLATLWRAAKAVSDRSLAHQRGAAIAVVMATACMAVHSFVDFNMHVPANALTFVAVLALAWCSLGSRHRDTGTASGVTTQVSLSLWAGLGLVVAAMVWTFWFGSAVLRADLGTAAARQNVTDWALDGTGWTRQTWKGTRQALLDAVEITPDDPVLHANLAQLYITQGVVGWNDVVQREAYFAEAAEHLQVVLRLRPYDGGAWATLAQARRALGMSASDVQEAWLMARTYAPREASVQRALALLVLDSWDDATPNMQEWLRQQWVQGSPAMRSFLADAAKRLNRPQVFR